MPKDEITQAQRDVLAVYPEVKASQDLNTQIWAIWLQRGRMRYERLGVGLTQANAWADAASKLPAPPVAKEEPEWCKCGHTRPCHFRDKLACAFEQGSTFCPCEQFELADQEQAGEEREPDAELICQAEFTSGCLCSKCCPPPPEQHGVKLPPRRPPVTWKLNEYDNLLHLHIDAEDAVRHIVALEARIRLLQGASDAQGAREIAASHKADTLWTGCDTVTTLADEVVTLKARIRELEGRC